MLFLMSRASFNIFVAGEPLLVLTAQQYLVPSGALLGASRSAACGDIVLIGRD